MIRLEKSETNFRKYIKRTKGPTERETGVCGRSPYLGAHDHHVNTGFLSMPFWGQKKEKKRF